MVKIPEEGALILCRSQPARFMRFTEFDENNWALSFKTGENEYGDKSFHCPVEHYEDMMAGGYWERVDSEVVE